MWESYSYGLIGRNIIWIALMKNALGQELSLGIFFCGRKIQIMKVMTKFYANLYFFLNYANLLKHKNLQLYFSD